MRPSAKAWLGLTGYVVVADTYLIRRAKRTGDHSKYATMSVAFGDGLTHPRKRWVVMTCWAVLTAHLFGVFFPKWMRQFDPIGFIARLIAR